MPDSTINTRDLSGTLTLLQAICLSALVKNAWSDAYQKDVCSIFKNVTLARFMRSGQFLIPKIQNPTCSVLTF